MAFKLDFDIFRSAAVILKEHGSSEVYKTLEAVENYLELQEAEFQQEMEDLKRVLYHYKQQERRMEERKRQTEKERLRPWIPAVRHYQDLSVYEDIKSSMIKRIQLAKKGIDNADTSLGEMKLRVNEHGRYAKKRLNQIQQTKKRIFTLETAIDFEGYMNVRGQDPRELAEFELKKYYEAYRQEG